MDRQTSAASNPILAPGDRIKLPSTRNTIFVLSTIMALQMTGFVMIIPLLAPRFQELGAGVEDLGVSAIAYALTATLAAPFMGSLADRFGRKPLVLGSIAGYAAAFVGFLFAPSAAAFILLRGLAGAVTAGLFPAVTGMAADLAPRERQAQWISFIQSGASFGWVAGPIAGGMIYDRWSYTTAMTVSIILSVIAFSLALACVPESKRRQSPTTVRLVTSQPSNRIKGTLQSFRRSLPKSLPAFSIILLIAFAVLFAWAFIEPRFMFYVYEDLNWTSSMLGQAMGFYGAAMLLGELIFGRLSDQLGRKPVILIGLFLFSAQFIGMAYFKNYILLASSFAVAGLGNALYDPALSASVLDISPAEHRARALGIKSMSASLGSIVGPAFLALLNSSLQARTVFLISVGVVSATILIVFADMARKKVLEKGMQPIRSLP